eukprot:8548483-Pyramimonas_sp.AAC.1
MPGCGALSGSFGPRSIRCGALSGSFGARSIPCGLSVPVLGSSGVLASRRTQRRGIRARSKRAIDLASSSESSMACTFPP